MPSSLRTCPQGHRYNKSSDCPTCPTCEQEARPATGFMSQLSAPARRALQSQGIATLAQLSQYSEVELLQLHGLGPASLPTLRTALAGAGLAFK